MKRGLIAFTVLWALGYNAQAQGLETVFEFSRDTPPANIAIGPDGRTFMSLHNVYGPDLRVVEVLADGETVPYPTKTWASAPQAGQVGLNAVYGLRVDHEGVLWMLDTQTLDRSGRVIAWDTVTESLHAVYYIAPPAVRTFSFLNDLAVDRTNEAIYISDTAQNNNSAIIVIDLVTGLVRRVLEGSRFTIAEDLPMIIDGREVRLGGVPTRVGLNPITVDPTDTWVYFAPMTSGSMYRIRTLDLLDQGLDDAALEARVERYGDKPISDGSTIDGDGNVYITSVTENAIGVTRPDGTYEVLYQSQDDLPWPDGLSIGSDGFVYATVNELHRSPFLNNGQDATTGAFSIVRFPALGPTVSGR